MADCSKTEVFFVEWERMCEISYKLQEALEIVQKWRDEHQPKTRQSEFLKMFPNVVLEDGGIFISPCILDTSLEESPFCVEIKDCNECRKAYWLAEVE